jgi:hypothetical protein
MPLSPPAHRQPLHVRRVSFEGYRRTDGLFDIDAHLVDVKDQDLTLLSGVRPAGEPVHLMSVRVTIDRQYTVQAIEAHTDASPYPGDCDRIHPAYARLVGANLLHGFRRRLHELLGGVRGCTHLTELLGSLPTAAVQTFASLRPREDEGSAKPFQLDRCHALDTTGDAVRRFYPRWHRRDAAGDAEPPAPLQAASA